MRRKYIIFVFSFFVLQSMVIPLFGQSFYEIKKAGFNQRFADDYAPVFFRGGILFTSNRKSSSWVTYENMEGQPTSNIYFISGSDSLFTGVPRLLDKSVASLFNEGVASFDSIHNILYFTRNLVTDKKKRNQDNNYGIFSAVLQGDQWVDIRPLPFNDPSYKTGHPAITSGGDTLFFASDRPGGKGGADIYMSWKEGDSWSVPQNLGPEVNSDSSELFPFYHRSGRLYFASNRRGTLGGLDIYFTIMVDGVWITPVHLQAPFNSPEDDFGFIARKTFASGLFTSSREGRDNIYMFKSLIPANPDCNAMEAPVNCFMFYETESHGMDTVPVKYLWDFGDGKTAGGHTAEHCYDNPGTYLARLSVTDTITGEVRNDVATYLVEVTKIEQAIIDVPDSCSAGEEININGSVEISGFSPSKYLWNFGDGEMAEGASVKKIFYEPGTFNIQLTVYSEPDEQQKIRHSCVTKKIYVKRKD